MIPASAVVSVYNGDIKRIFQILGVLILAGALLMAAGAIHSSAKGYWKWYFRVNGRVIVDGAATSGYLHANTQRTLLMVTRTDGSRPETYLVTLEGEKMVIDCGEWHPVRFVPFPVGDVNPPCSDFTVDPAKVVDAPLAKSLVREKTSVGFSTSSGKKIKAEW